VPTKDVFELKNCISVKNCIWFKKEYLSKESLCKSVFIDLIQK